MYLHCMGKRQMLGETKPHRQESKLKRNHLHPKEFLCGFVLVKSNNVSLAFCLSEDDSVHSHEGAE